MTKSPVCGGALDAGERGEARAQRVELLVDVGVGDLGVGDRDLEAVVVGQLDLGADVDLGGELQVAAVGELGDVDLGLAEGTRPRARATACAVGRRAVLVDGLVEHDAAAEALVDERGGHLALAEAGDGHLARRSSCTPRRGSA